MKRLSPLGDLVARLPEVYQPIFKHPELSLQASRACADRLIHIRQVYDLLAQRLGRPLRVLDIGCAQGFFSMHLAEAGAEVLGIDSREANIRLCEVLAQECPGGKATFRRVGIEEFLSEILPGKFDLFLGLSVFHHLCHTHGFEKTKSLVSCLAQRISVGICELALAEEPLPWAKSLPKNAFSLFGTFSFIKVLARIPTHLSAIPRPLAVGSSSYWFLGTMCGQIEGATTESHQLAKGTHERTRHYFRGDGLLIKKFSLSGDRAQLNRVELTNEARFLEKPPRSFSPIPKLLGWNLDEEEGWLVREEIPGQLLSEIQSKKGKHNARGIIKDVLGQLATLESEKLYHNDIRVWNTLVLNDGSGTLIDFGAISPDPTDCISREHSIYSFLVYVEEVTSGRLRPNPLLRFPYSNPAELEQGYTTWAERIWEYPLERWSFGLFLEVLLAWEKGTMPPHEVHAAQAVRTENLGRFIGLYENRLGEISAKLTASESDCRARGEVMGRQNIDLANLQQQNEQLTALVKKHEIESADRARQIEELVPLVRARENDTLAAAEQVQKLTELVHKHETESAQRLAQVEQLTSLVNERDAHLVRLDNDLTQVNQICRTQLAEKELILQSTHAKLTALDLEAQSRDQSIARQTEEIRRLDQLIHSGHAALASLQRAQNEASLANQLLALSAALPVASPTRWIQLPPANFQDPSPASVVFALETMERGPHTIRVSGWAFADTPTAAASEPPFLIFATSQSLWLLRGVTIERPDVIAAYPAEGAAAARLRSGFVFEFPANQLPGPVMQNLQVVFGQVSGVPVMTPPFTLP